MIDTAHKTMLGYVNALGLTLEDMNKNPGETFYFFQGQRHPEIDVVDQYRELQKRLRPDLQRIGQPSFFNFSATEQALDFTDLATYLDRHAADLPLIRGVLDVAYTIDSVWKPNSFYEYQGFMEDAALSGVATAAELIDDIRIGRI